VRGIVHSEGKGDAQVVYVSPVTGELVPLSARLVWSHDVTVTIQPFPPYVILDGEGGSIIEPLPGQELAAQQSIDNGEVLIRRDGVRGLMNPPGTMDAPPKPKPLPEVPARPDGLGRPPTGD
jgi:hypothetical protein